MWKRKKKITTTPQCNTFVITEILMSTHPTNNNIILILFSFVTTDRECCNAFNCARHCCRLLPILSGSFSDHSPATAKRHSRCYVCISVAQCQSLPASSSYCCYRIALYTEALGMLDWPHSCSKVWTHMSTLTRLTIQRFSWLLFPSMILLHSNKLYRACPMATGVVGGGN